LPSWLKEQGRVMGYTVAARFLVDRGPVFRSVFVAVACRVSGFRRRLVG